MWNVLTVDGVTVQTREASARSGRFFAACAELREALGAEWVHTDAAALGRAARSTQTESTLPRAIVLPANVEEVRRVAGIAARRKLSLSPLSTGRNWGYSDACAVLDGAVVVDLRRMNRIVEVDAELGYAIVEPGVTQGQLAAYLESHRLPFWCDATGAGPDTSLIGNTLERGFGHTCNGDRFQNSCGMEIVLADGRVLRTGFGHYHNAQAAACYKWGIGPYLDGLFTQSNFGIVTRMTIWLVPKPECFRAFFITLKDEYALGALVDALRPLRMGGTLRTPVHIFNGLRMLAGARSYPWAEMQGRTPLSPDLEAELLRRHGIDAWSASGGLYGSRAEVNAAEKTIRRALRRVPGIGRVVFVGERRMRLARWGAKCLEKFGAGAALRGMIRKLDAGFGLLQGRPTTETLRGAHWRVRPAPGAAHSHNTATDPLASGAGFLWISPVLPMTSAHVDRLGALAKPIFARHGFEYLATFSLVSARALCAILTVDYDKSNPDEVRRARLCHDELWSALSASGYIPYRAGNASMAQLDEGSEVFWDVAAALKAALDPRGILAPGHYEPARARIQPPGESSPAAPWPAHGGF